MSRPVHHLSRSLPGTVALPLPLCWDADVQQRHGDAADDEDWFTAWDQGAVDPHGLVFGASRKHVTCLPCLEWLHA